MDNENGINESNLSPETKEKISKNNKNPAITGLKDKATEKIASAINPAAGAAVKALNNMKNSGIVGGKGKLGKKQPNIPKGNLQNQQGQSGRNPSGSAPESSGSVPGSSGSAPNSSGSADKANVASDALKGAVKGGLAGAAGEALKNKISGSSNGGQIVDTAIKIKKYGPFIIPALVLLIKIIIILCIFGVILGPADTVIRWVTQAWDSLLTIVGYHSDDDPYWEEQYYHELEAVQAAVYKKWNVCIDINLITATLTVDMEENDKTYDGYQEDADDDGIDYNVARPDYRRMAKEVELLANMQIKRTRYGLDERTKGKAGSLRTFCLPEGEEYPVKYDSERQYYHLNFGWDSDSKLLSEFKKKWSSLEGVPIRASNGFRQIASNDIEEGLWNWFIKKANVERNIEYKFYVPSLEWNEDHTKKDVCNAKVPENKYDFAILSIANPPDDPLNGMEQSVYYWNLMDQFIADYYADYLPDSDGPLDEGDPRFEKIKNIVEDIYLLYNEMGESRYCDGYAPEEYECEYTLPSEGLEPEEGEEGVTETRDFSNVKVQLYNCNTKSPSGPELDLEDYVRGVVAAEIGQANQNYEAVKAQAIAARNFVLTSSNTKTVKSDGTLLLGIQNCNNRQVYQNPETWASTMSESAKQAWHDALNSVVGEVLVDASGNLVVTHYNSTTQRNWMNATGSTYRQMLMGNYSEAADIESHCEIKGGNVRGPGTVPGDLEDMGTGVCWERDKHPDYWSRFNGGGCTAWAYGRAVQILVENGGLDVATAKNSLAAFLDYSGRSDGNAWAWKNAQTQAFDGAYWDRDNKTATPELDSPEFQNAIREGAIVSWSGGNSCCGDGNRKYGHVAVIESVKRENGVITEICTSEGGVSQYATHDDCLYKCYNGSNFLSQFSVALKSGWVDRWVNGFVYLLG